MKRILIVAALAFVSACAHAQPPSAGSQAAQFERGETLTVPVGDASRQLILRARPSGALQPLVLVFHGGGGGDDYMAQKSRTLADELLRRGYAVAFMNGSSRRKGENLRTWNGGHCCAHAMRADINEAAYIDAAVETVAARLNVDRSRVFLMGHSNGGMVAYRAPAATRVKVRGVVVVSSAMFSDQPRLPQGLSVLLTHAKDDDNVSFDASFPPKQERAWDAPPLPFREAERRAASMLDCGAASARPSPTGVESTSRACAAGAELQIVVSDGGGHAWPRSIPGYSLGAAIADFLDRQK